MQLNKIIMATATYLGRDDIISYLEAPNQPPTSDTLETLNNLTRCANLVINELALSYIPMYKEETKNVVGNKVYFSSLTETALELDELFDDYGNKTSFNVFPEYVETFEPRVKIRYKYIPTNYGLNDEIGFSEIEAPPRIIAYGTASEFCLISRGYQESLIWRNRFCDALSIFLLPKNRTIKQRRFFL